MPIWDWHAFFPFAFFPNHSFCLMKEASKNYLKANDLCLYVDFFSSHFLSLIAIMVDFKMSPIISYVLSHVTLSINMIAHVMK